MRIRTLLILILSTLALAACGATAASTSPTASAPIASTSPTASAPIAADTKTLTQLSVTDLKAKLDTSESLFLLDVLSLIHI